MTTNKSMKDRWKIELKRCEIKFNNEQDPKRKSIMHEHIINLKFHIKGGIKGSVQSIYIENLDTESWG